MGIWIKLRENYHAKDTILGEPVKGKTVKVFKDKWTEVEEVTQQMVRMKKHFDIYTGDKNPNVKIPKTTETENPDTTKKGTKKTETTKKDPGKKGDKTVKR